MCGKQGFLWDGIILYLNTWLYISNSNVMKIRDLLRMAPQRQTLRRETLNVRKSSDVHNCVCHSLSFWHCDIYIYISFLNFQAFSVESSGSRQFRVTLTAEYPAPFVWLSTGDIMGRFSDNGFLMRDWNKIITFYAWEDVTVDQLKAALSVQSLMDIYK